MQNLVRFIFLLTVFVFPAQQPALEAAAWEAPIGIPTPPFGITEAHTMYAGSTFDYTQGGTVADPRGVAPYGDAGDGPYTHYVENSLPNCSGNPAPCSTDSNNPYGTPSRARVSVPLDLRRAV